MFLQKLGISAKLLLGFSIITLMMLAVLGYTYENFNKASEVVEINLSTYKLLNESDNILNSLLRIETGSRGFAITSDTKYLESFEDGKKAFLQHYKNITNLVSKNKAQLNRLKEILSSYQVWLNFETSVIEKKKLEIKNGIIINVDPHIEYRNNFNPYDLSELPPPHENPNSTELIRSGTGRSIMESMKLLISEINNEETLILANRSYDLKTTKRNTYLSIVGGSILIIIMAVIITFLTRLTIIRPIRRLITATEAITRHNYEKSIDMTTDKHLNVLISNFNIMQAAVKTREDELKNKNLAIKLQMDQVTEANKLKNQFMANMSHELRTPLNAIIGFTKRVIKKTENTISSEQLENLEIVKIQANHLLDLINNLLDYSKLESGNTELSIKPFDTKDFLDEIEAKIRPQAKEKNMDFKTEIMLEENSVITTDRKKLRQILLNLLINSVKFSNEGTILLSIELTNGAYCFKVKDNGIGIAEDDLEKIFDEFIQLDGSYTRTTEGTGIGLSITKKLVQLLNGHIEVISHIGEGSTFIVYIPIPNIDNTSTTLVNTTAGVIIDEQEVK